MSDASRSATCKLGEAAAAAEQGFLAAGQSLEAAMGILDRLTRRFANFIAELSDEALGDTRRDLAAASTHVATLAEARRSDGTALDTLAEIVTLTEHRISALQPITSEVETLSLSARVVAGGMGLAAGDFMAFAGNIGNAAQQARTCLQQARVALAHVDRDLSTARTEARAFLQQHSQTMQAIPRRLAENLRSLAVQQQLAADAATAAHRQSDDAGRQVAQQIVALQLGDITRQRLEHVQAAAQLLTTPQHPIGGLLAAQLQDAADELLRDGARIESGLRQLAQTARAIGQLGAKVHGETSSGGFLAALEADIRETAALLNELSAGDATTDRRMAAVLEAATALTVRLASVQSVQEDIRIMGLNATLKCGRLGLVGRPLAAVAQELRSCSGRFGVNAASVLQDLERLGSIATKLRDPSRQSKHAELAETTEGMLVPLRRLNGLEHELATALSDLQADADEVGRLAEAAVTQFAVHRTLAAMLRDAATDFAAWNDGDAYDRAVLDRIAAGYTMAREREVHARFAPLPQAAADELEDVLF